MKINNDVPVQTAEYEIESEYGLLECTFYPEKVNEHFYSFFSSFAKDFEDYNSTHPSFEKYYEKAVRMFAGQFPERLKELIEDIVEEIRVNTLIEINGISRKKAKQIIDDSLKEYINKKKSRMNAPNSGRPKNNDRDTLENAVIEVVKKSPRLLMPTLNYVASKLGFSSADALRKELKRHNLEWKDLRKRT